MRENVANIDHLPAVLDYRDDPVLVAADIQHGENVHRIGVPEILVHLREKTLGPNHPATAEVRGRLADLQKKLAK